MLGQLEFGKNIPKLLDTNFAAMALASLHRTSAGISYQTPESYDNFGKHYLSICHDGNRPCPLLASCQGMFLLLYEIPLSDLDYKW